MEPHCYWRSCAHDAGSKRSRTASGAGLEDNIALGASPRTLSCGTPSAAIARHRALRVTGSTSSMSLEDLLGSVFECCTRQTPRRSCRSRIVDGVSPRRTRPLHRRIGRKVSETGTGSHLAVGEVTRRPLNEATTWSDAPAACCSCMDARRAAAQLLWNRGKAAGPTQPRRTDVLHSSSWLAQQRVIGATYTLATLANFRPWFWESNGVAAPPRALSATDLRSLHISMVRVICFRRKRREPIRLSMS